MMQSYDRDIELKELMDKLRQTIKEVRSQIDVIENTVSPCENIEEKQYQDCINAVSIAEVEAVKFMRLNVELVDLLVSLRRQVYTRHL